MEAGFNCFVLKPYEYTSNPVFFYLSIGTAVLYQLSVAWLVATITLLSGTISLHCCMNVLNFLVKYSRNEMLGGNVYSLSWFDC